MHFYQHVLKRDAETEEHIRQAIRLDSNHLITFTNLAKGTSGNAFSDGELFHEPVTR